LAASSKYSLQPPLRVPVHLNPVRHVQLDGDISLCGQINRLQGKLEAFSIVVLALGWRAHGDELRDLGHGCHQSRRVFAHVSRPFIIMGRHTATYGRHDGVLWFVLIELNFPPINIHFFRTELGLNWHG
jgi:hypothetical protein